ncbi:hypothetical protein HYY73_06220 [Candidatus Woesearchaeota archaeon]|nr:hypothetical protein [Candidatus Woesearchaeota archaeon]
MSSRTLETIIHPEADTATFLNLLRQQFNITRIYYPGAGTDDTLESAFAQQEITYLDKMVLDIILEGVKLRLNFEDDGFTSFFEFIRKFAKGRNYVLGDFGKSPFADGTFGAVFYKDIHATEEELAEILRTLRTGGVVIHGKDICEGEEGRKMLEAAAMLGMLREVRLPYTHPDLTVFQKA